MTAVLAYLPKWEGVGPCVGQSDLMYGPVEQARALCYACPLLPECRAWVLSLPYVADPGGVVAAMTQTERSRSNKHNQLLKQCATCLEFLSLHMFALWAPGRDARRPDCRTCVSRRTTEAKAPADEHPPGCTCRPCRDKAARDIYASDRLDHITTKGTQ